MGKHYLKTLLMCSLLSYTSINYADDSEIYFSKDTSKIKPNIIFTLDYSGSMAWDKNGSTIITKDSPSRINMLKDSLEQIMTDPETINLRMGAILFDGYVVPFHPVIDIDELDDSDFFKIKKTPAGSGFTQLTQRVLKETDNGMLMHQFNNTTKIPENRQQAMTLGLLEHFITPETINGELAGFDRGILSSYRFNNILVKKFDPSKRGDIKEATLIIPRSALYYYTDDTINIFLDDAVNAPNLRNKVGYYADTMASLDNKNPIKCSATAQGILVDASQNIRDYNFHCNVTDLLRDKISDPNWQDGNAITFHIQYGESSSQANAFILKFQRDTNKTNPTLLITAKDDLIADNKKTNREKMLQEMLDIKTMGDTNVVKAMYYTSQYISNITNKTSGQGPYHTELAPGWESPLLESCQQTHMVLMTDGEPTFTFAQETASYLGQTGPQCRLQDGTLETYGPPEECGRALAEWMATTNHSTFEGGNFVRINTIRFAEGDSNFLKDIAKYGQGKYYTASNASELSQAFKDIILNALVVDALSTNGAVSLSPQTQYKQRLEVFYSLFKSENYNYWAGNLKGFRLKYINTTLADGSPAQRPILIDQHGKTAINENGGINASVSSLWSENDGGRVDIGGVLGKLTPDGREPQMKTVDSSTKNKKPLSNATSYELDLLNFPNPEAVRAGLLQFIRGYKYVEGGHKLVGMTEEEKKKITDLKIGDSARSAVTLATYGCDTGLDILNCLQGDLQQVALLASNDGFLRGYNTADGTTLYEIMPTEMLHNIQKLQEATPISGQEPRFYGLDGTVTVYHDDENKDGYINPGEKAMAYVIAGRGGAHLYAFDITDMKNPILKWTLEDKSGFENIGDTWSVPVIGKIQQGDETIPVLIFGGGYDTHYDKEEPVERTTTNTGNKIYVVHATDGKNLTPRSLSMGYSVPSSVAVIKDEESELITDIFVGDMGGQLWRLTVDNGNSGTALIKQVGEKGGIIACLAGSGPTCSVGSGPKDYRRFYHAPVVYEFPKSSKFAGQIAVSIGSGFRAHPLSTEINDRIYSLRIPKDAKATTKVITELDLAIANLEENTVDDEAKLEENGFYVKLGVLGDNPAGEKVVSEAKADFGRVVFNTYIPTKTTTLSCQPTTGRQRTYVLDLEKGISLLGTAYDEIGISTLPADIALYCNGKFCTFISGAGALSEKDIDPAYIVPVPGEGIYSKISTTDLFDL